MILMRLLLLMLLVGIYSCSSPTDDAEPCIVTDRYDDGTVREILCLDSVTGLQIITNYYRSGKLKAITEAKRRIPDGVDVFLFENGDTASVLEFKDGMLYGLQKWYYDGKVFRYNAYINDTLIGEEIVLLDNKMYEYIFRDNSSRILYHAYFDEYGDFVRDTGTALINMYVSSESNPLFDFDTLLVGAILDLEINVPRPHLKNLWISTKLVVENLTDGSIQEKTITIPENYRFIPYQVILSRDGKFRISAIVDRVKVSTGERHTSLSQIYLIAQ